MKDLKLVKKKNGLMKELIIYYVFPHRIKFLQSKAFNNFAMQIKNLIIIEYKIYLYAKN